MILMFITIIISFKQFVNIYKKRVYQFQMNGMMININLNISINQDISIMLYMVKYQNLYKIISLKKCMKDGQLLLY